MTERWRGHLSTGTYLQLSTFGRGHPGLFSAWFSVLLGIPFFYENWFMFRMGLLQKLFQDHRTIRGYLLLITNHEDLSFSVLNYVRGHLFNRHKLLSLWSFFFFFCEVDVCIWASVGLSRKDFQDLSDRLFVLCVVTRNIWNVWSFHCLHA